MNAISPAQVVADLAAERRCERVLPAARGLQVSGEKRLSVDAPNLA